MVPFALTLVWFLQKIFNINLPVSAAWLVLSNPGQKSQKKLLSSVSQKSWTSSSNSWGDHHLVIEASVFFNCSSSDVILTDAAAVHSMPQTSLLSKSMASLCFTMPSHNIFSKRIKVQHSNTAMNSLCVWLSCEALQMVRASSYNSAKNTWSWCCTRSLTNTFYEFEEKKEN